MPNRLATDEYAVAASVYGFDQPPNFENSSWNPARPLGDCPTLLAALDEALRPPRVILLRGPAAALHEWAATPGPKLTARDLLLCLPNWLGLPSALERPEPAQPVAWVCNGTACQPPVTDLSALLA